MSAAPLDAEREALISGLVDVFVEDKERFRVFLDGLRSLTDVSPLSKHIHSVKARLKDPEHLRDKLRRKAREAEETGQPFDITPENLFKRINDLAGLRILHLHTRQVALIHRDLLAALEEAQMPLFEEPFARTWDDESRSYFESIGIKPRGSPSMYTSVHYVVEANSRTKRTGEIQVRTLAEELWGEVDHTINYPHATDIVGCREQLRVLARVTSSCSRLVDAIFATHLDATTVRPAAPQEATAVPNIVAEGAGHATGFAADPKRA